MKEHKAYFRFYEELNDFLPQFRRKKPVEYAFNGNPSIKDAIEAQGIPHTEVDLLVVNGKSVDFNYQLREGDRVAVYPTFESIDISPIVKLRDEPLRKTRFVLDVHLGKLARILRMLGFDTLYRNDYEDEQIIEIALSQKRIILTRDRRMLFNRVITHAHFLHSTHASRQAQEVLDRFDLYGQIALFRRCPLCNGLVEAVEKEKILARLQPLTIKYYNEFFQCLQCQQVYWRGSHYGKILHSVKQITDSRTLK